MTHTVLHLHIPTHFILYHKLSVFAIANVIFSQNSPFRISFSRPASPYGQIDHDHNCSASPYGHIDHNRSASPNGNIDHSRSASPYGRIDHSHPASPYGNIDHSRTASPYGHIDHNRSASLYGNIDHNRPASPYGNIDHSPSFRITKPFEQLCRKFFVFF